MNGDILQRLYEEGDLDDETSQTFTCFGVAISDAIEGIGEKFGLMRTGLTESREQLNIATAKLYEPIRHIACAGFEEAQTLCGSPIERLLLPWLICNNFRWLSRVLTQDSLDDLKETQMALVPQYEVSGFRLDFAFVRLFDCGFRVVGIECDGKEFHKDKARDSIRDQKILESLDVLRLCRISGRFILRSPERAAARAIAYAERCWNLADGC